jgi:hypothetical protein
VSRHVSADLIKKCVFGEVFEGEDDYTTISVKR